MFRPLMFSSALPEVAEARGVRARRMELAFLLVMALATSMTVPVVGALLMFSLMIGPAAAARSLTARPTLAMALSVAIALVTVWAGIAISYQSDWPLGFFVGVIGAVFFLLGRAYRGDLPIDTIITTLRSVQGGVRVAGRIFISYRRADTGNQAGWLADRLAGHYGRAQVVKDVDSIQLGNDFADVIAAAVTSCDVLLALIGHQWLAAAAGPADYVAVEIELALTRGIRVIPVLVDGARMPTAAELPPGLAMLAQQPPLSLGAADPEGDVSRLIQALDQSIAARSAQWQATQAARPRTSPRSPAWPRPGAPRPSMPRPASPAGPAGASPFRVGTDQAAAPAPRYLGDRPGPGRCRRRGDRGVHRHPQRPPRVVSVFVVRARVCVCGGGFA